jgi:hypothetical protein
LAAAGFRKLFFGLESGSQKTLDHMDKGIQVAEVPTLLRNCREAGIQFHLFSIIGFPEETPARAAETLAFFERNADVIDDPGNSFDIHPFGLELRTSYASNAKQYGVEIAENAVEKEFVIGVGDQWSNPRGLSQDEAQFLIRCYNKRLRDVYRRFHAGPDQLWPAFEEFAVLYCDHYSRLPFRFRTSLPDDVLLCHYGFQWNPAAVVQHTTDGQVWVHSRYGEAGMTEASFELLAGLQRKSLDRVLIQLCPPTRNVNQAKIKHGICTTFNEWLARGLIQLEPLAEKHTENAPLYPCP